MDYHNLFSYEPENWDKKKSFLFYDCKTKNSTANEGIKTHKALQLESQQTQINTHRSNLHMTTRKINDKHQTVQPAKFCRYRLVIIQPLFATLIKLKPQNYLLLPNIWFFGYASTPIGITRNPNAEY